MVVLLGLVCLGCGPVRWLSPGSFFAQWGRDLPVPHLVILSEIIVTL